MPSVYIETSIISYLTARRSNDIRTIENQNMTIEWWEKSPHNFQLYISEFVRTEASRRRLEVIEKLPLLEVEEDTRSLAKALIQDGPLHKNSEMDAYHISIATVNGIDGGLICGKTRLLKKYAKYERNMPLRSVMIPIKYLKILKRSKLNPGKN
jgi:hypothetical protein